MTNRRNAAAGKSRRLADGPLSLAVAASLSPRPARQTIAIVIIFARAIDDCYRSLFVE
ncbi:MAG: hypothetical protein ACR2ID_07645 [Chthoniobacterales bacterium]